MKLLELVVEVLVGMTSASLLFSSMDRIVFFCLVALSLFSFPAACCSSMWVVSTLLAVSLKP